MGKREQAREEARFARGEVGVDGRATEEETQDASELEQGKAQEQFLRGKAYLGREFLTWLLWRSESGDPLLKYEDLPLTVLFIDRLLLRGISGDVIEETVKGAMSPYSPLVRRSLDRGLLIHAARLRVTHGEHEYVVGVDAEHLDFKGGKLPELLTDEEGEGIQERLYFADRLSNLVQALLEQFLRLRLGQRWLKETVPAMKEWMAEAADAPVANSRKRAG